MSTSVSNSGQNTTIEQNTAPVVSMERNGSFGGRDVSSRDVHVTGTDQSPSAPPRGANASCLSRMGQAWSNLSPQTRGFWKGLGIGLLVGAGATVAGVLSGATFGALPVAAAAAAAIVYGGGTATLGGIGAAVGYGLGKCQRKPSDGNAEPEDMDRGPMTMVAVASSEPNDVPGTPTRSGRADQSRRGTDSTPSLAASQDSNGTEKSPSQSRKSSHAEEPITCQKAAKIPYTAGANKKHSGATEDNDAELANGNAKDRADASDDEDVSNVELADEVPEAPADDCVVGAKKRDSVVTGNADGDPTDEQAGDGTEPPQDAATTNTGQNARRPSEDLEEPIHSLLRTGSERSPRTDQLPRLARQASESQIDWDVAGGARRLQKVRDYTGLEKPTLAGGAANAHEHADVADDVRRAVSTAAKTVKKPRGQKRFQTCQSDWETTESTLQQYATSSARFGSRPSEHDLTKLAKTVGPAARRFRVAWRGKQRENKQEEFNSGAEALFKDMANIKPGQPGKDFAVKSADALRSLYFEKAHSRDDELLLASSLKPRLQEVTKKMGEFETCDPNVLLKPGNDFYLNMLAAAKLCHFFKNDNGPFRAVATDLYSFYQALARAACPNSGRAVRARCQAIYNLAESARPDETGVSEKTLHAATRRILRKTAELATCRPTIQQLNLGAAGKENYVSGGRTAAKSTGQMNPEISPEEAARRLQAAKAQAAVARSQGVRSSNAAAILAELPEEDETL